MPTGDEPAFKRDLKKILESNMVGPPGGTFRFVGRMPPNASFTAVYGQSPEGVTSSTETVVFVVSNSSSHASAPEALLDSNSRDAATVAVPPSPSDGPEARARRCVCRARLVDTETQDRGRALDVMRRVDVVHAALDASDAFDVDAIALRGVARPSRRAPRSAPVIEGRGKISGASRDTVIEDLIREPMRDEQT
jgi:hypothetical protein